MLQTLLDVVLHLDTHLAAWSASMGGALYVVLFLVVFCETGLVVTPFLPGDSLLFAIGALCAIPGSGLDIVPAVLLLTVAAILGDTVNYKVGQLIGERAFAGQFRFISQKHLIRTKEFFDRYGRRAVVFARFAPILRTFAPFVAGVGKMPYARFLVSNVGGGIAWVALFCGAGYLFGNIPAVKSRFHIVIIAIIVVSLIPAVVEALRARSNRPTAA
ncbi:MAG TPA: DedA family protein [Polyangiaceae bacterium]|jgi:membrane-associated protein|nr:DedA family protein [Polyangiaceae bacterium]